MRILLIVVGLYVRVGLGKSLQVSDDQIQLDSIADGSNLKNHNLTSKVGEGSSEIEIDELEKYKVYIRNKCAGFKWCSHKVDLKLTKYNNSRTKEEIVSFNNSAILDVRQSLEYEKVELRLLTSQRVLSLDVYNEDFVFDQDISQLGKTPIVNFEIPLKTLLSVVVIVENDTIIDTYIKYAIKISDESFSDAVHALALLYGDGVVIVKSVRPSCFFVDTKNQKRTHDVSVVSFTKHERFVCESNHTNMLGASLNFTVLTVPYRVDLSTKITKIVSAICLGITIIILIYTRKIVKSDRIHVQLGFATSLFLLLTVDMAKSVALQNNVGCVVVAMLLQYFLLSTSIWMMLEGVTLLMKFSSGVLQDVHSNKFIIMRHVAGWGIPFVIVGLSASIGLPLHQYMNRHPYIISESPYQECWVKDTSDSTVSTIRTSAVLVVTISVVIFVLAFNLFVLIRVAWFVFIMSKATENMEPNFSRHSDHYRKQFKHLRASMRAILILIPVLGIPWILEFVRDYSFAMMYVNAVAVELQGLFVFLVYCISCNRVRGALIYKLKRRIRGNNLI